MAKKTLGPYSKDHTHTAENGGFRSIRRITPDRKPLSNSDLIRAFVEHPTRKLAAIFATALFAVFGFYEALHQDKSSQVQTEQIHRYQEQAIWNVQRQAARTFQFENSRFARLPTKQDISIMLTAVGQNSAFGAASITSSGLADLAGNNGTVRQIMFAEGKAASAIDAKDYRATFDWMQKLALFGEPQGQYVLGTMYDKGIGTPPDSKAAVHWYEEAAIRQYIEAYAPLGMHFMNGDGVAHSNKDLAFHLFSLAAEKNDPVAENNLGICYLQGLETKKNPKKAEELFLAAAKQDNWQAMRNLSAVYEGNIGIPADPGASLSWMVKAATEGDYEAQDVIGGWHRVGSHGLAKNFAASIYWFKKSAARGSLWGPEESIANLYLLGGYGIRADINQAIWWLERAAYEKDSNAAGILGFMYLGGLGITVDYAKAKTFLEMAASEGDPDGTFDLGLAYALGTAEKKSYVNAKYWFEKAAEMNNPNAIFYLGLISQKGWVGQPDARSARQYYERAGRMDNIPALQNLAKMYALGEGGAKDDRLAGIFAAKAEMLQAQRSKPDAWTFSREFSNVKINPRN